REFPAGAAELNGDEWSRRDFLKLMGASMALAGIGLTSCRKPEMHLVPFTKNVEWTIPGKFLYYATAMPRRTGAIPLIATTVDGLVRLRAAPESGTKLCCAERFWCRRTADPEIRSSRCDSRSGQRFSRLRAGRSRIGARVHFAPAGEFCGRQHESPLCGRKPFHAHRRSSGPPAPLSREPDCGVHPRAREKNSGRDKRPSARRGRWQSTRCGRRRDL